MRAVLFLYLGLIFCPISYWAPASGADPTWVFALNYAQAHHLVMGKDILFPAGPLAYLAAPMNIGNNLAKGLACQTVLWVVLLAVLWDLFFRGQFSLGNLAFFSVFVGLSGPLYHHYPNPLGGGDLLFVGALILLVHFRLRGGSSRYVAGLTMLGLVPLIKFVGVITGIAVLVGLIADRIMCKGRAAWRETALGGLLPILVAGIGYWLTLGSFRTIALYMKGSLELSKGYNLAMATAGPNVELMAGLEAVAIFVGTVVILWIEDRRIATFFGLLLVASVFLHFKHGFVRQDTHVVYNFCFIAVTLGLISLASNPNKQRTLWSLIAAALLLATLWQDYVFPKDQIPSVSAATGIGVPSLVWGAVRFKHLQQTLDQQAEQNFSSSDQRLEPEIEAIIQHEPVASLSVSYSEAAVEGLNLVLYPVLQRYSAYTPYLDNLNADWLRNKGPRFLILDEKMAMDSRHPWTETPAMWAEAYRWYDTRNLAKHTLLLERRKGPRFTRFELVGRSRLRFGAKLLIPAFQQPIFWTMKCSLTAAGQLQSLLFRVVDVTMMVEEYAYGKWARGEFRILPEVLETPSLGNFLPSNLSQFAAVFDSTEGPSFYVDRLSFGGPGSDAYAPECEVALLRSVP